MLNSVTQSQHLSVSCVIYNVFQTNTMQQWIYLFTESSQTTPLTPTVLGTTAVTTTVVMQTQSPSVLLQPSTVSDIDSFTMRKA